MKEIQLTQGKVTLVDDEDFEWLNQWKWCAQPDSKNKNIFYAARGANPKMLMHRQILNPPQGYECDHINRNTLDNRRCNLRIVTRQQNAMNSKSHNNSTSMYKGVNWENSFGMWKAQIMVDGNKIYLGCFDSEIEAAKAYNKAAIEYQSEFANLNKVV